MPDPLNPEYPLIPEYPLNPEIPLVPGGPTISPTLFQTVPVQMYKSPFESTMYASFGKLPTAGKSAGVATEPLILIDVPCWPEYPEKPLYPLIPDPEYPLIPEYPE
jgi:hypothetical protein